MKKLSIIGVCAIGLSLTACGNVDEKLSSIRLASAAEQCTEGSWSPTFADDGRTLRVQTDNTNVDSTLGSLCVMDALGATEALRSQIGSTTTFAGQRTFDDGQLRWTWTFNGLSGLDMVIETAG